MCIRSRLRLISIAWIERKGNNNNISTVHSMWMISVFESKVHVLLSGRSKSKVSIVLFKLPSVFYFIFFLFFSLIRYQYMHIFIAFVCSLSFSFSLSIHTNFKADKNNINDFFIRDIQLSMYPMRIQKKCKYELLPTNSYKKRFETAHWNFKRLYTDNWDSFIWLCSKWFFSLSILSYTYTHITHA